MIGVDAISRPVSELLIPRSASLSASHGMMISTSANSATQGQTGRSAANCPRRSATGSRTRAPITTLASTSTGTGTPPTATLMSRYGTPQMTLIAANMIHPRRLTASRLRSSSYLQPARSRSKGLAGIRRLVPLGAPPGAR